MKKPLIAAALLAAACAGLSAQAEETGEKLPQVILERDWWHFNNGIWFYQYQNPDGTLLKYKDVRSTISLVPENKSVLAKERGFFHRQYDDRHSWPWLMDCLLRLPE